MKKVYLHGALGKKFGKMHNFSAKNLPEVLLALDSNYEEFFEYIFKSKKQGLEYFILTKNPKDISSEEDLIKSCLSRSKIEMNYKQKELHFVPMSQGAAFFIPAIAAITWKTFIVMTIASVAISYAINALFKPPEPPKPGKQISTKSYLINGSRNRQAQGIPVPLGYGRLKIGSVNIDVKRQSSKLKRSTSEKFYALESFTDIEYLDLISEGPIGGFVNQNGGAISGGDIREGIFLNNVPVKSSVNGSEIFNYVLNEDDILPEFKNGASNEAKLLSKEVSAMTEYNTPVFGPGPYVDGKIDAPLIEYDDINKALTQGAKIFTHATRNQFVSKFVLSLGAIISQQDDSGNTLANSCRFAVMISKGGRNVNILDLGESQIKSLKINSVKIDTASDLAEVFAQRAKERIIESEWNAEKDIYKAAVEKIINSRQFKRKRKTGDEIAREILTEQQQEVYFKWSNSDYISREDPLSGLFGAGGGLFFGNESQYHFMSKARILDVNRLQSDKMGKLLGGGEKGGVVIDPRGFFAVWGIATSEYMFDIEIEFFPDVNYDPIKGATTISVVKLSGEYDPAVKSAKYYDGQFSSGDTFFNWKNKSKNRKRWRNHVANQSDLKAVGGIGRQRQLQVMSVQERIPYNLLYPNSSIAKLRFDSKNFKSIPNRTYHVKLKKVLIPSNYDPQSKTYSGPWDGLFKGQIIDNNDPDIGSEAQPLNAISDDFRFWTDNPAWIFFDLVQNPRYGLGKYGLEEYDIDKWQLYKAAKYCDELVETKYPIENMLGYPRSFTTNNILHDDEEDDENGSFTVSLYHKSFYLSSSNIPSSKQNFQTLDQSQFENEFGNGNTYRGKKVAFFIYIHNQSGPFSVPQKEKFAEKSALRQGKYIIEERVLKSSDSVNKTLTLYGPTFESNPATFQEGGGNYTVGACTMQLSHPIVESRFSCNLYLTERSEALEAMNNIAAVFRGLVGYNFGKIFTMQDSKKNPMILFNNSNIDKESGFSYSGIEKNKKFTSVLVRFNNKDKAFAPDVVYEEDSEAMKIFGYQEKEVMGMGVTSETQARRLAKWVLYSSQLETEQISFVASEEASYLYPGCIIEVSDENRAGRNMSGRVLDVGSFGDSDESYVLIDKSARDIIAVNKVEITVNTGLPTITDRELNLRAPHHKSSIDQDEEITLVSSPAPQMIKFQGVLSYRSDLKHKGPQGQSSIISELMVKLLIDLDIDLSRIKVFNHGFNEGDRVRFVSDGTLPLGLDKDKIALNSYYIVNTTEHSFQVSVMSGGDPVSIIDSGKDQFGNSGGLHYVCIENMNITSELTQSYINQIEVGAAYSIQGIYGTQISGAAGVSGDLSNLFVIESTSNANWFDTTIFGQIYVPGNSDWAFINYFGWVYIGSMMETRSSDQEYFWFWITGIGWISTNNQLHNQFWWLESESRWVYVHHMDHGGVSDIVGILFMYESGHSLSVGSKVTFKNGGEYKVIGTRSYGYFVTAASNTDEDGLIMRLFNNEDPPSETSEVLTDSDKSSNPGYNSYYINTLEVIDALDSVQNVDSIKLTLVSGHGLNLYDNRHVALRSIVSDNSTLDTSLNSNWEVIFLNETEVELVNSTFEAGLLSTANVNNYGVIEYVESIKNISLRSFQSQLFRILSVKENEYRKYEVSALEYNDSKFDAVDKNLSIKKPSVPIPPQADMDIPEAPENLILTDLTA